MPVAAVQIQGGVRFAVHVQPRAKKNDVDGLYGSALKLRVQAPPVDGAANEAVAELIAAWLQVPMRNVRIIGGATSRTKMVEVTGVTAAAITAKTQGL
jgi:uncharacterized protein (TIGR00251 family)